MFFFFFFFFFFFSFCFFFFFFFVCVCVCVFCRYFVLFLLLIVKSLFNREITCTLL